MSAVAALVCCQPLCSLRSLLLSWMPGILGMPDMKAREGLERSSRSPSLVTTASMTVGVALTVSNSARPAAVADTAGGVTVLLSSSRSNVRSPRHMSTLLYIGDVQSTVSLPESDLK